jgi:5-methylcytosine-specific restriction enzyme subunit McrC
MTSDIELRARLRRSAQVLGLSVSEQRIDTSTVLEALQAIDRRTIAYTSALTLIDLLLQSKGIALEGRSTRLSLPGFLFDMNRFFQALISRFLREHLSGYFIKDEPRLRAMFAYDPAHNPRRLRAPVQKPDFVVLQGTTVAAVLDAKYRDLWQDSLPRDMLYQLALYALGPAGAIRRSTIVYPTLESAAMDQVIAIQEPIYGTSKAYVTLRPVNLIALDDLLNAPDRQSTRRKRVELAQYLVFGRRS